MTRQPFRSKSLRRTKVVGWIAWGSIAAVILIPIVLIAFHTS